MSSIFEASYSRFFAESDFDIDHEASYSTELSSYSSESTVECSVTIHLDPSLAGTSTFHKVGLQSIFRLAMLRKQTSVRNKVQTSVITSLREQLREQDTITPETQSTHCTNSSNSYVVALRNALRSTDRDRVESLRLIDVLRAEKTTLEGARDDLKEDMTRLCAKLAEVRDYLARTRADSADLREALELLRKEKLSLETRLCEAQKLIQTEDTADADLALELANITAALADKTQAYDTCCLTISSLKEELAASSASQDATLFELRHLEEALSETCTQLDAQMALVEALKVSLGDEQARVQDLTTELETKDREIGALHKTRFVLECDFKKNKETLEDAKAELELSLFATELERDILLKNEADLTKSVKEISMALETTQACADMERDAKIDALANLHSAQSRIVSLQVEIEEHILRTSHLHHEISRLQAALQDRTHDTRETHADITRAKAQTMEQEYAADVRDDEVFALRAALRKAEEQYATLKRVLDGHRGAHQVFESHSRATPVSTKGDLPMKIQEVLHAGPDMATQAPSEEQDVQTADGEVSTSYVQTSRSVFEKLKEENHSFIQSNHALEEALQAKVVHCDELESQMARLEDHIRMLEKDSDWHTVVPSMYDSARSGPNSTPPKMSSRDKENVRYGPMFGMSAPHIIPIRRASTMTTDSTTSNATLVSASDSMLSNRLFNSSSLRKFFSRKPVSDESPPDSPFEDVHPISDEYASPAL